MSTRPEVEPPIPPEPPAKRRSYSGLWMKRIFWIALACALLAWLGKAVERAREAARFSQCYDDFKWVGLALQNYHDVYGSLPPAYLTDARGKPTLSWRVLILPFADGDTLYHSFNLSEPWDGPTNLPLLARMPRFYGCPSRESRWPRGLTKCVAITGPGTAFPGATSVRFDDITDGLDETILLAEVETLEVPWTAPIDLDLRTMSLRIDDPNRPSISSPHPRGPSTLTASSMVRFLPRSIAPESLRARMTIAGREPSSPD